MAVQSGTAGGGMGAGGGTLPKAEKAKPLTAEQLLAAIVSGTITASELTRKQLNTISAIKLGQLDYNTKDLKSLGLTKEDLSKQGFLTLKADLRDVLADDKVTRKELKKFGKTAGKTIQKDQLATLEDTAADLVPKVRLGLERAGVYNASQAQFARLGVRMASGVRGNIRTSALGAPAGGLARPTVLGGM